MMTSTPRLQSDRLNLEPFTERFLSETYVSWLNDPEVVKYSEQRHHVHTLASCREFAARFENGPNDLWAITQTAGGDHIGNISTSVDPPNQTADIALLIGNKSSWGKGYGSEAWIAVLEYLLDAGGIRKVTGGTMAANTGMLAIMRKAGMVEEGRRKGHFLLDGSPEDLVLVARWKNG